jgi:PAS domain-containing protein
LNVGVFRQSLDGLLLEGNPAFFRLLGLNDQSDAPTMRSLEPYFQPEDYAQLLERTEDDTGRFRSGKCSCNVLTVTRFGCV